MDTKFDPQLAVEAASIVTRKIRRLEKQMANESKTPVMEEDYEGAS